MIEISNVSKKFDEVYAIKNIDINVEKGTIHGIIGENGAGKTTLIQCLAGIYKQDKGNILIDGKPVYENPEIKSHIGYVADSCRLFPYYKVKNMINFYSQIYSTFSNEKFDKLNEIFKLPLNKRIQQLSKGMQMRFSFMLNISIKPLVLLLDEPTSGLDAIAKKQLLDVIIEEVEKNKITVFISSHHLLELEKLCDEITILNHGIITYQSSVNKIKDKVKKFQVVFNNVPDLSDITEITDKEKIGSVYYIITKNYSDELNKKLVAKGAQIIEEIGMNLEEIFIYTNKE